MGQLAFTVTIRPQGHELKDLEITNPHPAQRGPAVLQSPYWKSRSGTTLILAFTVFIDNKSIFVGAVFVAVGTVVAIPMLLESRMKKLA